MAASDISRLSDRQAIVRRPRLLIECTETYNKGLNTGIQRAVRNIVRHAFAVGLRYGFEVVPVVFQHNRFVSVDVTDLLCGENAHALSINATAGIEAQRRVGSRKLKREVLRPFKQVVVFVRRVYERFTQSNEVVEAEVKGDVLLMLDASWNLKLWPAVERFKRGGGRVVVVVYDLIPVLLSHVFSSGLTKRFKHWLDSLLIHVDGVICISRFTADCVADYLTAQCRHRSRVYALPVRHFYLGSELDLSFLDEAPQQRIVDIFASDCHIFLMVGSIEPRKNHAFVLDAFEQFWGRGGVGALVIVGSRSWLMNEFLARAATHPRLGKQLFLVRNATDADLAYCYKNASALIFASQIEGFGLPIVEAFQYGLRVICSDIPVFREIADGKATFFTLDDPAALDGCLADFSAAVDPSDRAQRHPQPWLTWEQSTEQLLDAVQSAIRQADANVREAREVVN